MSELIAVLYDQIAGVVDTDKHGDPRLEYDQTWREGTTSHPISLSLPIRHRQHENPAVAAYLWGLLPDNELVLQRWANRFGTTAGSAMGLLANVGEDCAGAIRFVSRSRLPGLPREGDGQVEWLAESDVATRLADLRKDGRSWLASSSWMWLRCGPDSTISPRAWQIPSASCFNGCSPRGSSIPSCSTSPTPSAHAHANARSSSSSAGAVGSLAPSLDFPRHPPRHCTPRDSRCIA